ncbi:MAG: epimerase [Clostridiales bacterium]|nr:epimerase [Clostridiales bacterium]
MWTEEKLDQLLATPSEGLIADIAKIQGDIMILGAGGKMGPTLAILAKNAAKAAGIDKKIIAVSRFSDASALELLHENGVETISSDLMLAGALDRLPDCPNIIYMAGRKFGTDGQEPLTWSMNAWLPTLVAERYRESSIVVFSSGNIYPIVPVATGGVSESARPCPIGEYTQSVLARERLFEYGSMHYGTKVLLYRLNYAIALRYGVLYDIASKVYAEQEIALENGCFNCIWQGDANEIAIRSLLHAESPAKKLNVTGPEIVGVRWAAEEFGKRFGKTPRFTGTECSDSYVVNAAECAGLFGYPRVSLRQMIDWQAEWILEGGRALGKPTHFEERKGSY